MCEWPGCNNDYATSYYLRQHLAAHRVREEAEVTPSILPFRVHPTPDVPPPSWSTDQQKETEHQEAQQLAPGCGDNVGDRRQWDVQDSEAHGSTSSTRPEVPIPDDELRLHPVDSSQTPSVPSDYRRPVPQYLFTEWNRPDFS